MSVDYRLLAHFEASKERLEAARLALPAHWRDDPRPEAQVINDHWTSVIARASERAQELTGTPARARLAVSVDDR